MQRCVAIVWTRAGLPHDGCVDCDVCEYSVVDGLARYIVRILSYRRLTPQICTRSRETLCTRPTLAGTPRWRESELVRYSLVRRARGGRARDHERRVES